MSDLAIAIAEAELANLRAERDDAEAKAQTWWDGIGKLAATLKAAESSLAAEKQRVAKLEAEQQIDREVITEANNSLYGSQGYFLKLFPDSTVPTKYHLANGIENLKARSNKLWRETQDLKSEVNQAAGFTVYE